MLKWFRGKHTEPAHEEEFPSQFRRPADAECLEDSQQTQDAASGQSGKICQPKFTDIHFIGREPPKEQQHKGP